MHVEELEEELKKLKLMEANTPEVLKKLDQEFWILVSLKDLYQMCKDVNQLEVVDYTKCNYVPVKRVVKSKVMVPNYILRKYNIPYVMFSGLFLVVLYFLVEKVFELEKLYFERVNDFKRDSFQLQTGKMKFRNF